MVSISDRDDYETAVDVSARIARYNTDYPLNRTLLNFRFLDSPARYFSRRVNNLRKYADDTIYFLQFYAVLCETRNRLLDLQKITSKSKKELENLY